MARLRDRLAGLRGRLVIRAVIASLVLAALVGSAFTALLITVDGLRNSGERATATRNTLATADIAEKLVIDLETGQRGFIITGQERFLQPWRNALTAAPRVAQHLVRITEHPEQKRRARTIAQRIAAYISDYSVPLVEAARRNDPKTHSAAVTAAGKRRVDAIRVLFDRFTSTERNLLDKRQRQDEAAANRAVVAALAGLGGSVIVILLMGGSLLRSIVLPIRRVSTAADRLAAGDLAVRTAETGIAEIGALERSFNAMGASLEENRDELRALAAEQGALRRVATLVARDVPPQEVLDAVAKEATGLLGADSTALVRLERDGRGLIVAGGELVRAMAGDGYVSLEGDTITGQIQRTGRPARMDVDESPEPIAANLRAQGMASAVGAPIIVEGRVWGVMASNWGSGRPAPPDAEARIEQFTELVATAIANAENRAELIASRARVVAASDESRRRIERDLHDGAQQRIVHTVITLKLAQRALRDADGDASKLMDEALEHAERGYAELRELAHGILPPVLTRGGLRAAVAARVSELPIPVSVDIPDERFSEGVEATAYFIVSEALANLLKHAQAERAWVTGTLTGDSLRLEIADDGVGGARIEGGSSGLLGLRDRAAALGGQLQVDSPPGGGTTVVATLPLGGDLQPL